MKNIIIAILLFLKRLFTSLRSIEINISRILNQMQNKSINITQILDRDDIRCKIFYLSNNSLLDGKPLLEALYHALLNNEIFKEFGFHKVIIISAINNGIEFNYHHNILINNLTTFEEYFDKVKDIIEVRYEDGYEININTDFKVIVWNMDDLVNKNIKITRTATTISKREYHTKAKSCISPIKLSNRDLVNSSFATIDLETIMVKGVQECILISFYNDTIGSKIFLIDPLLMKSDINLAKFNLWKDLFGFLDKFENLTIFAHNLGSFDGYFIFKQLSVYAKPEEVSTIIDKQNKFIYISYKNKIVFKDSFRIFPVSLNELCKIFNVDGKINKYNELYNNANIFDNDMLLNEFKNYCIQDSKALFNALNRAQEIYIDKYSVDITSIFSTSTLSLKIFRTKYLETDIPVLNKKDDNFIRQSYLGGATDYYKAYGKFIRNYDVTSLYPFSMCKPMPYKILKFHKDLSNFNLDNFFGFILAEITVDKNIVRPMLPYKYNGKTIFPTGTFTSTYFSEELKAVSKLEGYKIKLISGYEFSKIELFSKYIEEFFAQKKYSVGAERFIAKMHLNQLYGYFGRSYDVINTLNVNKRELNSILLLNLVKTFIKLNENLYVVLIEGNIDIDLLKSINIDCKIKAKNIFSSVQTNVSIASAITSYARVEMIPYKLDYDVLYSDTDSIFTTDKLPDNLISNELGFMKDELEGEVIKEGYFLGIKQYGYWIKDKSRNNKEFSTFAGIKRNSLSFKQIVDLHLGKEITVTNDSRFYKSLTTLSISILPSKSTLKRNNDKTLINNIYHPIHISTTTPSNPVVFYLKRMVKLFNKFLKSPYYL